MGFDRIPKPGRKPGALEAGLVSIEDSRKEAETMLEKHREQLHLGQQVNFDDELNGRREPNATGYFLQKVPGEIAQEYFGHGVNKGTRRDIVASLLNVVSNKSLIGDTGPLLTKGMAVVAYTHAPFLLLSHYKKPLVVRGADRAPQRNSIGHEVDIAAVVVNNEYYPLIDDLKVRFPDMQFIKASELPEYMTADAHK